MPLIHLVGFGMCVASERTGGTAQYFASQENGSVTDSLGFSVGTNRRAVLLRFGFSLLRHIKNRKENEGIFFLMDLVVVKWFKLYVHDSLAGTILNSNNLVQETLCCDWSSRLCATPMRGRKTRVCAVILYLGS